MTVVANVSAMGNLRHPVMTDSNVVTSDVVGEANEDEDVANLIAAMAASTIFNSVDEQTTCSHMNSPCASNGQCCSSEYPYYSLNLLHVSRNLTHPIVHPLCYSFFEISQRGV